MTLVHRLHRLSTRAVPPLTLGLAVLLAGCAGTDPTCPGSAAQLPLSALYGDWRVRFDGDAAPASVRLWAHPDYPGVRGEVKRPGVATPAQLAGDVNNEGVLLMDESDDGKRISAVWEGELQPRSCGRALRGTWRRAGAEQGQPFELTRNGGTP